MKRSETKPERIRFASAGLIRQADKDREAAAKEKEA